MHVEQLHKVTGCVLGQITLPINRGLQFGPGVGSHAKGRRANVARRDIACAAGTILETSGCPRSRMSAGSKVSRRREYRVLHLGRTVAQVQLGSARFCSSISGTTGGDGARCSSIPAQAIEVPTAEIPSVAATDERPYSTIVSGPKIGAYVNQVCLDGVAP